MNHYGLEKSYCIWQPTVQTLLSEYKPCQAAMVRDLLRTPSGRVD